MVATVSVEGSDLRAVNWMLRQVPVEFRRDLTRSLRAPGYEIVARQREAVRAIEGAPKEWKSTAARSIRVDARLTGPKSGIAIKVRRSSSGVRAAWLLNRGWWDHPTFGRNPTRRQTVRAGWFDETGKEGQKSAARATADQLERSTVALARRIDRQSSVIGRFFT